MTQAPGIDLEAAPAVSPPGEAPAQRAPWTRRHLLDTDTLSLDEVRTILDNARSMAEVRTRPIAKVATLRGLTVANVFYESSTRTRASFEVAGKALGADVVNISASASSVAKGESLADTIRTIEAVGADIVVLRHPHAGAPHLAARVTGASIVNAGDGAHAHPTQALLDLLTLDEQFGSVRGLRVVIVGDLLHSRVVRSNLGLLPRLGAKVVLCGPPSLLPRHQFGLEVPFECTTDLDAAMGGADVVMALRLQRERQDDGRISSVREYTRKYQVTAARLERAALGVRVMHPGPMNEGVEVAPDVAAGPQSLVQQQVTAGVSVRMALLHLLGSTGRFA